MVWGLMGETSWDGEDVSEEDVRPSLHYSDCFTDHHC